MKGNCHLWKHLGLDIAKGCQEEGQVLEMIEMYGSSSELGYGKAS